MNQNASEIVRYCVQCGSGFQPDTSWQKYCSRKCSSLVYRLTKGRTLEKGRYCKQCGLHFYPPLQGGQNQQHCSQACARLSARDSRSKFWQKHGKEKARSYYKRTTEKIGKDGNLKRFRRRHPDIEIACQSCGEDRVVDIAHRPGHKRNGAWRSAENTTAEKIWILCPTCHALLDRMHYSPSDLGLR